MEIDNGIFCVGEVTEKSKIVKIYIDEKSNVTIKDDCNLSILMS